MNENKKGERSLQTELGTKQLYNCKIIMGFAFMINPIYTMIIT